MQVTQSNLSQAVASVDAHRDYAIQVGLLGKKSLARKHQRHAKAIMREIMAVTAPDLNMSDDELLAELEA